MKKAMLVLLNFIIIVLFVSCGQNVESGMNRLDELKSQYDHIGLQHNMKLDDMLSVYMSQPDIMDRATCEKMADEYFVNSGTIAESIMKLINRNDQLSKPTSNSDVIDELADSIEIYAKYPEVFDPMSDILDGQFSIEEKIGKLEDLYLLIDEKAENSEDRESLMNGLSTTIHSLTYWHENYDEWQNVLNPSMGKATIGIAGAIGIIDGAGAVIGTLEGIRDTYKGQEGRVRIIIGRAVGEAAKTSTYVVLSMLLL